jgi:hypothetical protein
MEANELLAHWDAQGLIVYGAATKNEDTLEAEAEVSGELLTPGTTLASFSSLSAVEHLDLSRFSTPEL